MTDTTSLDSREAVLLVIRSPGNRKVLSRFLAEHGLTGLDATDPAALDRSLARPDDIRLALVDVSGFGADVWALCERIRAAGIPFIVLSPARTLKASHEALAYGALSVLEKPIDKAALVHLLNGLHARRE